MVEADVRRVAEWAPVDRIRFAGVEARALRVGDAALVFEVSVAGPGGPVDDDVPAVMDRSADVNVDVPVRSAVTMTMSVRVMATAIMIAVVVTVAAVAVLLIPAAMALAVRLPSVLRLDELNAAIAPSVLIRHCRG